MCTKKGKKSGSEIDDKNMMSLYTYHLPVFGLGFPLTVSQDVEPDDGMKIPYACRADETACYDVCSIHLADTR